MTKHILLCNEASYRSTGFSTYGLEVLKRLHATGKYELAEYATYGDTSDPAETRWEELPWKFYPVKPNRNHADEVAEYNADPTNQFGSWRFEQTCLDFRPDIVFDIRDHWMLEYQERSPFRPYYHWAIMPTVDAFPQDEWWMATYANADGVFSYSDWGLDVLKQQSSGRVKTVGTAPPGADFEALFPITSREEHRQKLGLPPDSLVIGTVMRNQKRKLYPDLIRAFASLLETAPPELANRLYLYLHVYYPDVGWDIPTLLKEAGIGHRTLFTYACSNCGAAAPSFYADAVAYCRACGQLKSRLPHPHMGVSREALNRVYNFFDVYVQYANSEGFGMPMVEAAAAGVPVMAVDYSAMSDVVRKLRGFPIKVLTLQRECETGCYRAVPDNADLISQLVRFLRLPEAIRRKRGHDSRSACQQHYNYDRTARVWEDYFDSVNTTEHSLTWESPPQIHRPPGDPPAGLPDAEWVRWGITHLAGRPDLVDSFLALRMIRNLTWGLTVGNIPRGSFNEFSMLGMKQQPEEYTREHAYRELLSMGQKRNYWEQQRARLTRGSKR